MRINHIHLIAFSPCGTTLASVKAIGDGLAATLGAPVTELNLTLPAARTGLYTFGPNDLAVFAFPVYGGRLPHNAGDIFAALRGNQTPAILAAVYGNRDYEDALLEMQREAEAKGFAAVAATAPVAEHCMAPEVAAHRPDAQDKDLLFRFGRAAGERVRELPSPADAAFTAPGDFPYRKDVLRANSAPKGTESCTRCGTCVSVCPAGAIPAGTPETADDAACIVCLACVKACPESARKPTHATYEKATAWLRANCMERKEPAFFPESLNPA